MLGLVLPAVAEPQFGLPLNCPSDSICPIQQFVDVDAGSDARDPWCGTQTYDGHKGTDFRVLSMQEVKTGVEVVAMADGVVKARRDGMADRLVSSAEDREAISSRECGNGLVVDHGNGLETQYCHLRQGSLKPAPGAKVAKGQVLGLVGASGMAAFPHVHVTLRRNGKVIDPFTGLGIGDACSAEAAGSAAGGWLDAEAASVLGEPGLPTVLAAGFFDGPVDDGQLVRTGVPAPPDRSAQALVGYIWVINLRKGDRVSLRIERDGEIFARQTTEPLDRSKAVYVAYAGKKGAPAPGRYRLEAGVVRQGETILVRNAELQFR
ncbi:M23 family metallopeptidase [Hoeflea alexandrii]